MERFPYGQPPGMWEPNSRLVIEDGALQGLPATMLGCADQRIVVAVTLADRVIAVELDAGAVRLDGVAGSAPLTLH
jgi:hypothetical protein